MTWPHLQVSLFPLPWEWRVRGYVDAQRYSYDERWGTTVGGGSAEVQVGPVEMRFGWNWPMFIWRG